MKSQFYREVSNEHKTRKSTVKNKLKKIQQPSGLINHLKCTKGVKSASRGLIHSIDISKRHQPEAQQPMLRISFSRPLINHERQEAPTPLLNQNTLTTFCCDCQSLKLERQRQLKAIKMHFQEEVVTGNEKFIQMEKKYLFKENQYIKLSSQYLSLLHAYEDLEQKLKVNLLDMEQLKDRCDMSELEVVRLNEEIKKSQEQSKFFNNFLTAFVEQTKCMLNWSKLFEKTCQQLPTFVNLVKQELFCRKVDLDLILKESVNYQNQFFGSQYIKDIHQDSCFFDSQQDSSSSFLKYLKHNPRGMKIKSSRIVPLTELKERNAEIQIYSHNKENMDTFNRPSPFETLIHSRLKQKKAKERQGKQTDDFFRMLLIQAQTIESTQEYKGSSLNSGSHYEINTSLLSSITKNIDHDLY